MMEVSIGDLVDRASILLLKRRHAKNKKDRKQFDYEWRCYWIALSRTVSKRVGRTRLTVSRPAVIVRRTTPFDSMRVIRAGYRQLTRVNGAIWDLESDIRKGKEKKLGLEEVGRRALKIRDLNAKRIALKNDLNKKFNSGFLEKKIDHASEKIDKNRYRRVILFRKK